LGIYIFLYRIFLIHSRKFFACPLTLLPVEKFFKKLYQGDLAGGFGVLPFSGRHGKRG
jgi:hypothetical protein